MPIAYCSKSIGDNYIVLFDNPLQKDSCYNMASVFASTGDSTILNYLQHNLVLLGIVSEMNGLACP